MNINKIVWIGDNGFDNGGAATLGLYYQGRLNIRALFNSKEDSVSGITLYSSLKELKKILDELSPEVLIILPDLINQKITNRTKEFFDLLFYYQQNLNTKIIYIDCTRNGYPLGKKDKLIEEFDKMIGNNKFDSFWSITGQSEKLWSKYTKSFRCVDINIYQLSNKTINDREETIGYVSRYASIKGIGRLVDAILERINKKENKYSYIHIGSDHAVKIYKEKGIVSGLIAIVNKFAISLKDKRPKNGLSIKCSLEEKIEKLKYNIYPRYSINDLNNVYSKVGIAICPTLAKINKDENNVNYLFSELKDKSNKHTKYLKNYSKYWKLGMEYVNYEMIDYGIPVMFSRDYCMTYDPSMIDAFPNLIYNNLEECLDYVEKNYNEILNQAVLQKEWLSKKLEFIEQEILNELKIVLNS